MGSARAFSRLCGISLTAAGGVHGRHGPPYLGFYFVRSIKDVLASMTRFIIQIHMGARISGKILSHDVC
jgi:hypothetical protein